MNTRKLNNVTLAVFTLLAFLVGCNNTAETKTTSDKALASANFKVWGNCEMCQETIEAALKTKGVNSASWNADTKILVVKYDSTVIELDQIHKLVAASGYDTERYRADQESYNSLQECCQYERRP